MFLFFVAETYSPIILLQPESMPSVKGHPNYRTPLMKLGIVEKVDEKILRRGGYTKVGVYGIKDIVMAQEFLKK